MNRIEQQRQQLARWLAEWQLEAALGDEGEEALEVHVPAPAAGVAAGGGGGWPLVPLDDGDSPAPGSIRLLAPVLTGARARPVYVAVLERTDASLCLVAPFGRFAEPALPGELRLPREDVPLRVLCVWNARWVAAGGASQSWRVGALTAAELGDSRLVQQHVFRGAPLPPALRDRVGPPLCHPDDPRVVYQARERLTAERWLQAATAGYHRGQQDLDQRQAAEGAAPEDGE